MSTEPELMQVAWTVEQACIAAACRAYADAARSGLCGEGALEAAVGAMPTLDLAGLMLAARERGAQQ